MAIHGLARVARKTASLCGDICLIGCGLVILPFWCFGKVCIKCKRGLKHHARQGPRCYLASDANQPLQLPLRRAATFSSENLGLVKQRGWLMLLPFDVRKRIWEMALGEYELHIMHESGSQRLTHRGREKCYEVILRIFQSDPGPCECSYCSPWVDTRKRWKRRGPVPQKSPNRHCQKPSFNLIKSCRQVYQECMPIIYGKNKFVLCEPSTVPFFVQSVRKNRIAQVRTLSLSFFYKDPGSSDDWLSACFVIATWMQSLETLSIEIVRSNSYIGSERALLEPLRAISGLKTFDLSVRYPGTVAETPGTRAYQNNIRRICMRPRGEDWHSYAKRVMIHPRELQD